MYNTKLTNLVYEYHGGCDFFCLFIMNTGWLHYELVYV